MTFGICVKKGIFAGLSAKVAAPVVLIMKGNVVHKHTSMMR